MVNETRGEPALTPEEWKGGVEWHGENWEHHGQIQPYLIGGTLSFDCDDPHYARECTPHQRHQVAALALHEQPFGFTREDVDALRANIAWLIHHQIPSESIAHIDAIREKIAALLPPEWL